MNLGQLIGELRLRISDLESGGSGIVSYVRQAREKGPTKKEQVLAALRGGSLSLPELHSHIGGSRGALGVCVAQMKGAGQIVASGEKYHYRYSLP